MLASAFAPRSHRRQGGDALQWLPKRAALASDPVLPVCSMRSTGKTAGCPCAAACDHHGLTLTTIARLMTAKTYQRADSGLPLPISRWTASMTTISPPPAGSTPPPARTGSPRVRCPKGWDWSAGRAPSRTTKNVTTAATTSPVDSIPVEIRPRLEAARPTPSISTISDEAAMIDTTVVRR